MVDEILCDSCCKIGNKAMDPVATRAATIRLLCAILDALGGSVSVGVRRLSEIASWCAWDQFTTDADSTESVLNVPGHNAIPGYLISFTSGQNTGIQSLVTAITVGTITISPELPFAPAPGDAFDIFRPDVLTSDCDGNLNVKVASGSGGVNATVSAGVSVGSPLTIVGFASQAITLITSAVGGATAWVVDVEVSIDGTTYSKVATATEATPVVSVSGLTVDKVRYNIKSVTGGTVKTSLQAGWV